MSLNNFTYSVNWGDFSPVSARPAGHDEDAAIEVKYGYSYNMDRNKNAVVISSADVDITMVPGDCWVVDSKKTNDLLKHEQGHYDITALGAREFYNNLIKLSAKSIADLKTSAANLNAKFQRKINAANKRYDDQADHGAKGNVQKTWDQAIAAEMQKPNGSIDNLPQ
jgi:hypothetical protein